VKFPQIIKDLSRLNQGISRHFKLNDALTAIMATHDEYRTKRSRMAEQALRAAILAGPLIMALLCLLIAYGTDHRPSTVIDKTTTGSVFMKSR